MNRWLCGGLLLAVTTAAGCGGSPTAAPAAVAAAPQGASRDALPVEFLTDYRAAVEQARAESKPLLVFFTARWCDYCRRMRSDAFSQQAVRDLSERFVLVAVDADDEPEICRDFRVRAYPTVQFLSPRGVPLNRLTGQQTSRRLSLEMTAALEAVARRNEEPETVRR